ncbi:hypothetical protein [Nocardia farcinica]|uniref:hypothetical protein n=1 Tax=Nocardia farcinica TaxID=37329 RepID=UPI0024546912|nr:hypothetical protein [Nocardia farcinica]
MVMNPLDDVVECLTERWHESDDVRSLPEYLGMTAEQFGRWSAGVMSAQELQTWADRRASRVGEAP